MKQSNKISKNKKMSYVMYINNNTLEINHAICDEGIDIEQFELEENVTVQSIEQY